jgi:adenine phosphoribosyltransferase
VSASPPQGTSEGTSQVTGITAARELERSIRTVPDFPRLGISYKDVTPVIEDGNILHAAVDALATAIDGVSYDRILSAEARGFVFGTALAYRARKGLVLARKPNKLPRETISASYDLEYGKDALEIHTDSIPPGTRVLVADDLLATGGTARAMCQLVEKAGGTVASVAFLIELGYLSGRDKLRPYDVISVITYDTPDD